uniref:Regulator of G-protein signaling 16 n=1 Tax=Bubo bubo TaxID=30461 RepID=A0A8C0EX36_BUBBB
MGLIAWLVKLYPFFLAGCFLWGTSALSQHLAAASGQEHRHGHPVCSSLSGTTSCHALTVPFRRRQSVCSQCPPHRHLPTGSENCVAALCVSVLEKKSADVMHHVWQWSSSSCFCPINCSSLPSPGGVTAFHTFLKTEFSEENLDFWLACEDFKKTRSKTKLASKANRIFEEFVQSEAPREVNIDHETREITRKNLSGATSACFNEAQAKTRTLMEKDSYPRFLKSASYQDMTKQVTSRGISKRSHT